MMPSSESSSGTIDSGPAKPRTRRRLVPVAVALVAAGGATAALLMSIDRDEPSPPVSFVEAWIAAWNERDAQTVSSMTCDYIPAFVAAGTIEDLMDDVPRNRPVVGDHEITGTDRGAAFRREGVQVHVTYVAGAREGVRRTDVFVRVRDDGDMCIGYPLSW